MLSRYSNNEVSLFFAHFELGTCLLLFHFGVNMGFHCNHRDNTGNFCTRIHAHVTRMHASMHARAHTPQRHSETHASKVVLMPIHISHSHHLKVIVKPILTTSHITQTHTLSQYVSLSPGPISLAPIRTTRMHKTRPTKFSTRQKP